MSRRTSVAEIGVIAQATFLLFFDARDGDTLHRHCTHRGPSLTHSHRKALPAPSTATLSSAVMSPAVTHAAPHHRRSRQQLESNGPLDNFHSTVSMRYGKRMPASRSAASTLGAWRRM